MTAQEAIDYLLDPIGKREQHDEAIRMAISALQAQDSKTIRICDTCKHDPPEMDKWPCMDCDMREPADRWEAQDVPDTNVGDMISRLAAIDEILRITTFTNVRELYEYVQEHNLTEMWCGGINDAIDAVIAVPSAQPERCEDCENFGKTRLLIPQPEIIHCENCKNWQTGWRNREWGLGYHWCSCVDGIRRSDWFCADAERRTDETD